MSKLNPLELHPRFGDKILGFAVGWGRGWEQATPRGKSTPRLRERFRYL